MDSRLAVRIRKTERIDYQRMSALEIARENLAGFGNNLKSVYRDGRKNLMGHKGPLARMRADIEDALKTLSF